MASITTFLKKEEISSEIKCSNKQTTKMTNIRSLALPLQENTHAPQAFTCLYDKLKNRVQEQKCCQEYMERSCRLQFFILSEF